MRGFLHGTAAAVSVVGAVSLWLRSAGNPSRQLVLLVFGLSLVALYTVSSLYHSVPWRAVWKERMQRVDHSMIYLLVAGTYTPIAAVVLQGWAKWIALAAVWGIALAGIVQKIFAPRLGQWVSITMQTAQGWVALPLLVPLARALPWSALLLTMLGGIFYTVGMVLFVTRRPHLWPRVFSYHEVFHVCVVAGSSLHYLVMFQHVARFTGPQG